jgi:hypothetical protein
MYTNAATPLTTMNDRNTLKANPANSPLFFFNDLQVPIRDNNPIIINNINKSNDPQS